MEFLQQNWQWAALAAVSGTWLLVDLVRNRNDKSQVSPIEATLLINRDDAVGRLLALLAAAAVPPKPRRPTRPTLASKQRRLEGKSQRSGVKRLRTSRPDVD